MVSTRRRARRDRGPHRDLGSEADTLLLTELRALADAVLIGTGRCAPRATRGWSPILAASPGARRPGGRDDAVAVAALALVRPALGRRAVRGAEQPVLVYTGSARALPEAAAPVEVVRLDEPRPRGRARRPARPRRRALLCEGGPTLNRALLAAGVVDELFLTLAPLLAGNADAPRIVEGDDLPDPLSMQLAWVLRHGDELFLRYRL